ncbi:MAG: DsbA family protein [Oscillochloris sp.]|nr:DsbA family protein [Oscillochloris sp.]
MRSLSALVVLAAIVLSGCGTSAASAPTASTLELRQSAVALELRPTLPALPTSLTKATAASQATPSTITKLGILQVTDNDPRALGSLDAPVTIYEFTDFECPFCVQFFQETRPQLIEQYVNTGKVRLVARDFPLFSIHASALLGAMAGHCAADQQLFWPMYEQLFTTHQEEWGGVPKRDRDVMIELAGKIGIDTLAFTSCIDDPDTEQAVRAEADAASKMGVNSTPNFMINGQLIRGALPFSSFDALISQALEQ